MGLPRCFSDTDLFGRKSLQLLLKSISPGYRQEETRLVLELREFRYEAVKGAAVMVNTRCK